jgi:hypothetical protein
VTPFWAWLTAIALELAFWACGASPAEAMLVGGATYLGARLLRWTRRGVKL